jgi:hypothetical protein
MDCIESVLPPNMPPERYMQNKEKIDSWVNSAIETAGWNLSILFAQLTGDGMGVGDALNTLVEYRKGFNDVVEKFVGSRVKRRKYRKGERITPDCSKWAEAWVTEVVPWKFFNDGGEGSQLTLG